MEKYFSGEENSPQAPQKAWSGILTGVGHIAPGLWRGVMAPDGATGAAAYAIWKMDGNAAAQPPCVQRLYRSWQAQM
eukprot:gene13927-biopygen3558